MRFGKVTVVPVNGHGPEDVVVDGLQFANGVALPPDESFVAVAETGAYRVTRIWLTGDRAGQRDTLVDNLSGFPDNIATGSDGLIWVTLASPRVPALEVVRKLPTPVRAAIRRLPTNLQLAPGREVGALGVSADGRVERELRGKIEGFHVLVGIREHHGRLWFGSLEENAIAFTDLEG